MLTKKLGFCTLVRLAHCRFVVAIAQLVEHWIVIPGVAGSIPVGHPIFMCTEPLIVGISRFENGNNR